MGMGRFNPDIRERPPENVSGGILRQELREVTRYPTTDMSLLDP